MEIDSVRALNLTEKGLGQRLASAYERQIEILGIL